MYAGESVTIWKDVLGVLNADPKWFSETQLLPHISYKEAVELAYYGATIIHPKTIKPLQNKTIPLYVKSFLNPSAAGTVIDDNREDDATIPSFIFKINQVFISILPKDFSFIVENNISHIFELIFKHKVKVNMMQHSAISFSVSVDYDVKKVDALITALNAFYEVQSEPELELVTVRHYDDATIQKVTEGKEIYVEQKTANTARILMKDRN